MQHAGGAGTPRDEPSQIHLFEQSGEEDTSFCLPNLRESLADLVPRLGVLLLSVFL